MRAKIGRAFSGCRFSSPSLGHCASLTSPTTTSSTRWSRLRSNAVGTGPERTPTARQSTRPSTASWLPRPSIDMGQPWQPCSPGRSRSDSRRAIGRTLASGSSDVSRTTGRAIQLACIRRLFDQLIGREPIPQRVRSGVCAACRTAFSSAGAVPPPSWPRCPGSV